MAGAPQEVNGMANPLGIWLTGCAMVMLVGMPTARAATSRIVFSGAVVEPTCFTAELGSVMHNATGSAAQHLACGRTATDAGRTYMREVIDLVTVNRSHDRLLDYFASYAPRTVDGDATAKIVVHTYD
jgi:DNA-binding transcriptional regulator PaaX